VRLIWCQYVVGSEACEVSELIIGGQVPPLAPAGSSGLSGVSLTIHALVVSRAQCLSFVITFERLQNLPMKAVQPALGIPVIIPVYDIAALIVAEA
jgi:hypothetical protein